MIKAEKPPLMSDANGTKRRKRRGKNIEIEQLCNNTAVGE